MPGSNALEYDDGGLFKMQKENFRRIHHKLKKRMYIKFTEEMVVKLKREMGLESCFNFNLLTQTQFEIMFTYLYKKAPGFFVEQEPDEDDLAEESFFEQNLDAGYIMMEILLEKLSSSQD